jgi:predicted nucleic acid-binding protein
MKKKIYIETSVVSYYSNRPSRDLVIAARQQVTREWWEANSPLFDLYISVLVMEEAGSGNESEAQKRLEALNGLPILGISTEAETLADALLAGPIPKTSAEDALHIALAAVNGIDFLLTWNFRHINNAMMKKQITRIVESNGYECPILCSPEELGES